MDSLRRCLLQRISAAADEPGRESGQWTLLPIDLADLRLLAGRRAGRARPRGRRRRAAARGVRPLRRTRALLLGRPARAGDGNIPVSVPRGVGDGHRRRHPLGPDRHSAPPGQGEARRQALRVGDGLRAGDGGRVLSIARDSRPRRLPQDERPVAAARTTRPSGSGGWSSSRRSRAFIRRWFFHDDGSFKAAFHTFKTPDQFEQQLETHLRKLIREKVEKAEQPGGLGEGEIVFHGVPYPGLKVFGLEDAPVFYGRARALAAVKEALQAQAGRNCAFLLIFGMSGSGKSSLVRAGLVHALTATPGWIEGVDVWRWCLVRPGDATGDPLDALAQALFGDTALPELRAGGIDAARLARTLRDNPDDVDLILGPRSARSPIRSGSAARRIAPWTARLLVVVDQMEELFTRDWLDEPGRARYVAALAALARSGAASVVATMRSDFFARCAELPELVALKEGQGQLDLLPPTFAEIGQMIRYPARDAALRWGKDPDQPGQTLDDVLQEAAWRDPKALPLLQFTLNELFRRRDGRTLTCEAYRALGGWKGRWPTMPRRRSPLSRPRFRPRCRRFCARWSPPVRGTTSRSCRAACRWSRSGDPIRRRLLDVLIDARLLVTDRDDRMQPVVGIAHEALLTHWPRLKDLLDKDREFLRARTRVAAAAERWRRESRHVDSCTRASRSPRPASCSRPGATTSTRDDRIHRPLG